jgi:hypothetical protein
LLKIAILCCLHQSGLLDLPHQSQCSEATWMLSTFLKAFSFVFTIDAKPCSSLYLRTLLSWSKTLKIIICASTDTSNWYLLEALFSHFPFLWTFCFLLLFWILSVDNFGALFRS